MGDLGPERTRRTGVRTRDRAAPARCSSRSSASTSPTTSLFYRPTAALASLGAQIWEGRVIAGSIALFGIFGRWLSGRFSLVQSGLVRSYALAFALGIARDRRVVRRQGRRVSGAGMHSWTATLLWLVPLATAIVVGLLPLDRRVGCTLGFGALAFLIADLGIAAERFHPDGRRRSSSSTHSWVTDIGLGYHVGLDGLSLVLCGLVAFVAMWCLAYGVWAGRSSRGYVALSLLLVSALMLLFVGARPDPVLRRLRGDADPARVPDGHLGRRAPGAGDDALPDLHAGRLAPDARRDDHARPAAGSFDLDADRHQRLDLAVPRRSCSRSRSRRRSTRSTAGCPPPTASRPPEVAAMLSGVVSKAGAYGMLRFALPLFPGPAADWQPVLLTRVARRPALVLARRLPAARLARRDRLLVDRAR